MLGQGGVLLGQFFQTGPYSIGHRLAYLFLIIALFAVFERKRQEVLGLVEQLKSWEA